MSNESLIGAGLHSDRKLAGLSGQKNWTTQLRRLLPPDWQQICWRRRVCHKGECVCV